MFSAKQMHPENDRLVLINSATETTLVTLCTISLCGGHGEKFHPHVFHNNSVSIFTSIQSVPGFKVTRLQFLSKRDLAALWFMKAVSFVVLLVKSIQRQLGLLPILYGAVGHGVSHDADLAQEDLPEEQINPRVKDLVEGGQADRRQEKVTV